MSEINEYDSVVWIPENLAGSSLTNDDGVEDVGNQIDPLADNEEGHQQSQALALNNLKIVTQKHFPALQNNKTSFIFACVKCKFTTNWFRCLIDHWEPHGTVSSIQCCNTGELTEAKVNNYPWKEDLKCPYCMYNGLSKVGLQVHMARLHVLSGDYPCSECRRSFRSTASLLYHRRLYHPGSTTKIYCTYCQHAAPSGNHLNNHIVKTHSSIKKHKCNRCKSIFSVFKDLTLHNSKCNTNEVKKCDFCLSFLISFKMHKCKKNETIGKCPFCEFDSSNIEELLTHYSEHHLDVRRKNCSLCKFSCIHLEELTAHIIEDHPAYKLCNFCVLHIEQLVVHMRETHLVDPIYKCTNCWYTSYFYENLLRHNYEMHSELVCDYCISPFVGLDNLILHMKDSHIKCSLCCYIGSNVEELMFHISDTHFSGELEMDCPKCMLTYRFLNELQEHKTEHKTVKHLSNSDHKECNTCNYFYFILHKLIKWIETDHFRVDYYECEFRQKLISELKLMLSDRSQEIFFNCPKCFLCFTSKNLVINHYYTHHNSLSNLVSKYNGYLKCRCPYCGFVTSSLPELRSHILLHRPHSFSCTGLCSFICQDIEKLIEHINECHNTDSSFQCPLCQLEYSVMGNLFEHIHSEHAEEYNCLHCQFNTFNLEDLMLHIDEYHGYVYKHKCMFCESSFSNQEHLLNHVGSMHTPERMFACPNCNYKTFHKNILKGHVLEFHKMKCLKCVFSTTGSKNMERHIHSKHLSKSNYISCDKCDFKASSEWNLITHRNSTHQTNDDYSCYECEFTHPLLLTMRKHVLEKHKVDGEFACILCDSKFKSSFNILNHLRRVHDKYKLNIPITDFYLKPKGRVSEISIKIDDAYYFRCFQCHFKTISQIKLQNHISVCHSSKISQVFDRNTDCDTTFGCAFCKFSAPEVSMLINHIQICHGWTLNNLYCKLCGYSSITMVDVKVHFQQEHSQEHIVYFSVKKEALNVDTKLRRSTQNILPVSDFQCYFCTKFPKATNDNKSRKALRQHVRNWCPKETEHFIDQYYYKCPVCFDEFASLDDVKQHISNKYLFGDNCLLNIWLFIFEQLKVHIIRKHLFCNIHFKCPFCIQYCYLIQDIRRQQRCGNCKNSTNDKIKLSENYNEIPINSMVTSVSSNMLISEHSNKDCNINFICDVCSDLSEQLITHIKKEYAIERYMQSVLCKRKFDCQIELVEHIASMHKTSTYFQCPFCSCVNLMKSVSSFNEHVILKHNSANQDYQCSTCLDIFQMISNHLNSEHKSAFSQPGNRGNDKDTRKAKGARKEQQADVTVNALDTSKEEVTISLVYEQNATNNKDTLKCPKCKIQFCSVESFEGHHDVISCLMCPKCKDIFENFENMTAHLDVHKFFYFKCDYCTYSSVESNEFSKHLLDAHSENIIFISKICRNDFANVHVEKFGINLQTNASKLLIPMNINSNGDLRFINDTSRFDFLKTKMKEECFCCYCDTKSDSADILEMHFSEMHGGLSWPDSVLSCRFCKSHFGVLCNYLTEMHENTKVYICPHCDEYQNSLLPYLVNHIFTVHSAEGISCWICNVHFVSTVNLTAHIQENHSEIRVYKCKGCPYYNSSKDNFFEHISNVHFVCTGYTCFECSSFCQTIEDNINHYIKYHHWSVIHNSSCGHSAFIKSLINNYVNHINRRYTESNQKCPNLNCSQCYFLAKMLWEFVSNSKKNIAKGFPLLSVDRTNILDRDTNCSNCKERSCTCITKKNVVVDRPVDQGTFLKWSLPKINNKISKTKSQLVNHSIKNITNDKHEGEKNSLLDGRNCSNCKERSCTCIAKKNIVVDSPVNQGTFLKWDLTKINNKISKTKSQLVNHSIKNITNDKHEGEKNSLVDGRNCSNCKGNLCTCATKNILVVDNKVGNKTTLKYDLTKRSDNISKDKSQLMIHSMTNITKDKHEGGKNSLLDGRNCSNCKERSCTCIAKKNIVVDSPVDQGTFLKWDLTKINNKISKTKSQLVNHSIKNITNDKHEGEKNSLVDGRNCSNCKGNLCTCATKNNLVVEVGNKTILKYDFAKRIKEIFVSQDSFEEHRTKGIRYFEDRCEFQCNICKVILPSQLCVIIHLRECSTSNCKVIEILNEVETHLKKIYSCLFCGYSVADINQLKQHFKQKKINTIIGIKKCHTCNFYGRSPYVMKVHSRSHDVGKEFSCTVCRVEFFDYLGISNHIHDVHTPSYVCPFCNYSTKNTLYFKNHIKIHYNTSYKCPMCFWLLNSIDSLSKHMEKEHKSLFNLPSSSCPPAPLPSSSCPPAPRPSSSSITAPLPSSSSITAPLPSSSSTPAPLPSSSSITALLPSSSSTSAPLPSSSSITAPLPSSSSTPAPLPSSSCPPAPRPSSSSITALLPSSSSITALLPSSSSTPAPLPSSSSITALLPSSSSTSAPRPSSSSITALLPSSSSITALLPSSSSITAPLPSSSSTPAPLPSSSCPPAPRPSSSSITALLPSSSSITALLPSSSSTPAPLPSSSSITALLPSSSSTSAPRPSSSSITALLPSSSSITALLPSSSSTSAPLPSSSSITALLPSSSSITALLPSSSSTSAPLPSSSSTSAPSPYISTICYAPGPLHGLKRPGPRPLLPSSSTLASTSLQLTDSNNQEVIDCNAEEINCNTEATGYDTKLITYAEVISCEEKVTGCNSEVIDCDAELSDCDALVTDYNAEVMNCDTEETESDSEVINFDEKDTSRDALVINCNVEETDCNGLVIDCDGEGTDCDAEVTDLNALVIDCVAEGTDCNVELTDRSALVIDCDAEGTDCNAELTDRSALVIDCDAEGTDCNTELTDRSVLVIDCDAEGTDCNAELTDRRALVIDCDAEGTDCDAELTDCSALVIDCDAERTDCDSSVFNKHTSGKKYNCSKCLNFLTGSRKEMIKHLNKHDKKQRIKDVNSLIFNKSPLYKCPLCGLKASSKDSSNEIEEHINTVHKIDGKLKCTICDFLTLNLTKMKIHFRHFHSFPTSLTCKNCSYRTTNLYLLQVHFEKNHQDLSMERCQEINDGCLPKAYLQEEKSNLSCTQQVGQKCQRCNFIYREAGELASHIKENHSQQYECLQCLFRSHSLTEFDTHTHENHPGSRYYSCPHCKFMAVFKEEINLHVTEVHSDIGTQECPVCKLQFTVLDQLIHHMTTTHGKQYNNMIHCSDCRQLFISVADSMSHFVQVHVTIGNIALVACVFVKLHKLLHNIISSEGIDKTDVNAYMHLLNSIIIHGTHESVSGTDLCLDCKESAIILINHVLSTHIDCKRILFFQLESILYNKDNHKPSPTYNCHRCHFNCNSFKILLNHVDDNHVEDSCLKCLDVSKTFVKHIKKIHCNKSFKCNCEFITINKENFDQHFKKFHCFSCNKCSFVHESRISLEEHMYVKHVRKKCPHCSYASYRMNDYKEHLNIKHGEKKIAGCIECGSRFKSISCMLKHLHSVHRSNAVTKFTRRKCSQCDFTTSSCSKLERHEKVNEHIVKCSYCNMKYNSYQLLNKHLLRKHKVDQFTCSSCSFHCLNLRDLEIHLAENHKSVTKHVCSHCGFKSNRKSFISHIQKYHEFQKKISKKDKTDNSNSLNVTTIFKCLVCDYSFSFFKQLKNHVITSHENVSPRDVIDLKLKEKDELLSLNDSKNCIKSESSLENYQSFNSSPTGEGINRAQFNFQYFCFLCNASRTTLTDINNHMIEKHRKDGLLICSKCTHSSKTPLQMYTHVHKKPCIEIYSFICEWCCYKSNTVRSFRNHIRSVHGLKSQQKHTLFTCSLCNHACLKLMALIEHYKCYHLSSLGDSLYNNMFYIKIFIFKNLSFIIKDIQKTINSRQISKKSNDKKLDMINTNECDNERILKGGEDTDVYEESHEHIEAQSGEESSDDSNKTSAEGAREILVKEEMCISEQRNNLREAQSVTCSNEEDNRALTECGSERECNAIKVEIGEEDMCICELSNNLPVAQSVACSNDEDNRALTECASERECNAIKVEIGEEDMCICGQCNNLPVAQSVACSCDDEDNRALAQLSSERECNAVKVEIGEEDICICEQSNTLPEAQSVVENSNIEDNKILAEDASRTQSNIVILEKEKEEDTTKYKSLKDLQEAQSDENSYTEDIKILTDDASETQCNAVDTEIGTLFYVGNEEKIDGKELSEVRSIETSNDAVDNKIIQEIESQENKNNGSLNHCVNEITSPLKVVKSKRGKSNDVKCNKQHHHRVRMTKSKQNSKRKASDTKHTTNLPKKHAKFENNFKCIECPFSCKFQNVIKNHIIERHEKKFRCLECKFGCRLGREMTVHIKNNHKHRFNCPRCRSRFSNTSDFNLHIQDAHNNTSIYHCPRCTFVSTVLKDIIAHTHTDHNNFVFNFCSLCKFKTTNLDLLMTHIKKRHSRIEKIRSMNCALCNYKTKNNAYTLSSHIGEFHSNCTPYGCPYCDNRFPTLQEHLKHFRENHFKANSMEEKIFMKITKCKTELPNINFVQESNNILVLESNINLAQESNINLVQESNIKSTDNGSGLFKCPHCDFNISNFVALRCHMKYCQADSNITKEITNVKHKTFNRNKVPHWNLKLLKKCTGKPFSPKNY